MRIYRLNDELWFPNPAMADAEGLLAVGGDLSPERLVFAYRTGIFPWYGPEEMRMWWSPDPRFVLRPDGFKCRRSLRKVIKQQRFEIHLDRDFPNVIGQCSKQPRPGQNGTWLVPEMVDAYIELHRLGIAHSVEAWREGQLVGGLYGIALGPFFFGESMFHLQPDASKVALAHLVKIYREGLIDCQLPNPFFADLGAEAWPRARFLSTLKARIDEPSLWPSTQPDGLLTATEN